MPAFLLAFGLVARRQLAVSTPLWLSAAVFLRWAISFVQPGWNAQLVDRFLSDTPPLPITVGKAISLVSLGSDLLYSIGILVLLAVAVAEFTERTRDRLNWGDGRLVSWLSRLNPVRTWLWSFALALVALGSLGPGVVTYLLSD
ncbi:MAG: hypothetical protein HOH74_29770 [Gemmatimonadetes bacterium]|nr:hypothetical protein [Gemmatimonadota bacterium]